MAQRRYGPTRGAGVTVIELEGEKTIEQSALGYTGYGGVMEKGPVGELIEATNKAQFLKKCGSYVDDSMLPDVANQFYDIANGAGGLLLVRTTDGNEAQAEATLYARYGDLLTPMGTLKAHNGGRWGGKEERYTADLSAIGKLAETTLDTEVATFKTDEWKGGYIELSDVANSRYPIIGNTAAGVISVASDQTMLSDHSGGADLRYYLVLENEDKAVSYLIQDGEENPDTEFAISVYVDGDFLKKYPNLSTDPTSSRYWVNVINNDDDNYAVEAVDLWTGAHTAAVRPANIYGKILTVTATVLTAVIHDFTINSPVGLGDPTFALGATTDAMRAQKITITMADATNGTAVSDKFGALGAVVLGTPFVPNNKWTPPFTVTAGGTALVATDTLVINYKPMIADSLIGGRVFPDKPNSKLEKYRIVDNDHKTITAADGSDMTTSGATDDYFLVEAAQEMDGGRDGHSDLTDADYNQQLWDTSSSPFNRTMNRNLGLVKMATPGITSTSVQKAGKAYAEAKNYQYRYECPSATVTESGAITYVNDTLGRSDFAVMAFPSYCDVADPEGNGEGKRKTVPNTGMIHGREARTAADYDGYHKAAAGLEATLPAILAIPTGDVILDEEALNPVGIAVVKKIKGNFVIWGDRMLALDPTWKWKHQRELMSHYEHNLQENFDWIVFAINDAIEQKRVLTAVQAFFLPEWQKRALRGDTFEQAAIFKIDNENNTNLTMANGDMNLEILLRLADTVERLKISIGKQGIFDSAA